MTITADDKDHLRRCIELAAEAVERTNEVVTKADVTVHPELTLAS